MSVRVWTWLAWKLPKQLIYWATIRAGVHATTGSHSGQVVPELYFSEVLQRWQ
jgi:hypothetical protein